MPDQQSPSDLTPARLHFQPTSPRGHRVAARRKDVVELARSAGFANVRIFGSVARGDDGATSDIDLLVTLPANASLFTIARLERDLTELLGAEVDVVPDSSLQPHLADRVHAEAVNL